MDKKQMTINAIRVLSAEQIQKANSGHPGLPLGAAPMAYTLWADAMKHNPKNPEWINRDRFILSAGHGSAMLYSLLHLFGYGLTKEDLMNFRQMDALTPGHPEYGHTAGVEATTGPLGQGLSMAVGMAMAEAHLASKYNKEDLKPIDHYTYVLVGDGCLMEGITNEASSLAGHLGLSKLIVLYDSNNITIEGDTNVAFTENIRERYKALGWNTCFVEDGNNTEDILKAIETEKTTQGPSLIEIKTKIGYGSVKEGKASAHGEPLGEENLKLFKENLGWEVKEAFEVPSQVKENMEEVIAKKEAGEKAWDKVLNSYKEKYPECYEKLMDELANKLPEEYLDSDEYYNFEKDMATRASSGEVIQRLAKKIPSLIGGSADLAPSNKTEMKEREFFSRDNYSGSNIHFGIREHAMAAICNGMAIHGGTIPYCATFLIFSDYLKPAVRLSALMKQRVVYVFTHDSIGVGEDGPTHQPIEQLAMLRSIPNTVNFRPADARETAAAWAYAVRRHDCPTSLSLSRQTLKNIEGTGKKALKGGYILKEAENELKLIIIATGSEVELGLKAKEELEKESIGVRLVSMPSVEVFEMQDEAYRNEVLSLDISKRMVIEAQTSFGWHKYALDGAIVSMNGFGASAPGSKLFEKFGFTKEHVLEVANKVLNR